MRAVNLIPVEERRGGAGGGSGPPTVWLLVGLGVLVAALAGFVLASNQVSARQAKLVQISTQADSAQASVAQLTPYVSFASMEQNRTQTVRQLAATRFDWHQSLHDLARVMSKDVWLTSVTGTVAPNVTLDGGGSGASAGGGGGSSGLRSALPNPALSIAGCATSNDQVVSFVSRLRVMNGVIRVSLSDAQKSDTAVASGGASSGGAAASAPASGSSGGGGGDCTGGSDKFPKFDVVVFYKPLAGAASVASAPGSVATPASATGAAATKGTASPPAAPGASSTSTPGQSAPGASSPGASSPAAAGASK